jgi:predicted TIM-barrel fold metal-dependent hydrolase
LTIWLVIFTVESTRITTEMSSGGTAVLDEVISADNHVNEPRDLWLTRLPAALRHRAPRVLDCPTGGEGWSWDGSPPTRAFGMEAVAGRSVAEVAAGPGLSYADILPGNHDPGAHLADMDLDGVHGVVVFPLQAVRTYALPDRAFALACLRAYNDWVLDDFQGHDPTRIVGLPMLPVDDGPDVVLAELHRCVDRGARAFFVPGLPARPYHHPGHEPLWAAAAQAGVPLCFHRTFGGTPLDTRYDEVIFDRADVAGVICRFFSAVQPLTYLILSGTFERHPGLRVVAAEVGCGWMVPWLELLDRQLRLHDPWAGVELSGPPSEVVGRNVFVTILDDLCGFEAIAADQRIAAAAMYSTDYPHAATLWPRSREWIEELTADLDPRTRRRVLSGNARRVFGFDDRPLGAASGR